RRHPEAGANHRPAAGLEMKVKAGAARIRFRAHTACCVAMMEPAGSVGLVRRLVLGEADVAIDAKHRSLGITADLRRELGKACIQIFDQLAHWLAHFAFVFLAMRLEPGLFVMPRQLAEETQCALCKCHMAGSSQ